MLSIIEQKLLSSIKALLGEDVRVGRYLKATPAESIEVALSVQEMKVDIPETHSEVESSRSAAFAMNRTEFQTSGLNQDFTIGNIADGKSIEVEAPPGFPLQRGDDYFIEGDQLKFYKAPPAGNPGVLVTISGDPVQGYREHRGCRIKISLISRGIDSEKNEVVFNQALGAVFKKFTDIGIIRSQEDGSGVSQQLSQLKATLESINRDVDVVDGKSFYRNSATILVFGEFELTVRKDAAEEVGRISEIVLNT